MTRPIPLSTHARLAEDGVVQRVRIGSYGWIERDSAALLCVPLVAWARGLAGR